MVLPCKQAGTGPRQNSSTNKRSFSVQLNTNGLTIACRSSNPNPPGYSSKGSPCTGGDLGVVQFTYQSDDASNTSAICIWNVDVTKQLYYPPQTWQQCVNVPRLTTWPAGSLLRLFGDVDPTSHQLSLIAEVPWSKDPILVIAPDWFGLCWTAGELTKQCAWSQASGTMLGYGVGSQANFGPKAAIMTTVTTMTNLLSNSINKGSSITSGGSSAATLETNNLFDDYFVFPSANCWEYFCSLTWVSHD